MCKLNCQPVRGCVSVCGCRRVVRTLRLLVWVMWMQQPAGASVWAQVGAGGGKGCAAAAGTSAGHFGGGGGLHLSSESRFAARSGHRVLPYCPCSTLVCPAILNSTNRQPRAAPGIHSCPGYSCSSSRSCCLWNRVGQQQQSHTTHCTFHQPVKAAATAAAAASHAAVHEAWHCRVDDGSSGQRGRLWC